MLKVGITGGIGSGKSTVCRVFDQLGIPVFYADEEAKHLLNEDNEVRKYIIELFGEDLYDTNNKLIRPKLASLIFNDKLALSKINSFLHPLIINHFNQWADQQKAPYVIEEAALIYESGHDKLFDKIIVVTAPLEIRISRVMERDCTSREKVLERINNQLDEETKREKADFIIENDNRQMLIPQIINIHNLLLS